MLTVLDLVVLAVVVLAAISGWRVGGAVIALHILGVVLGLILGLGVAGLLSSSLSAVTHLLLGAGCALGGALIGGAVGRLLGRALARVLQRLHIAVLDHLLGALARAGLAVLGCWLVAVLVLAIGPASWSAAVRSSAVFGNGHPVPVAGHALSGIADALRAAAPADVAALVPSIAGVQPSQRTVQSVSNAVDGREFVIGATGCRGSVVGTGFVAARGLVVTNAHVVRAADQIVVRTGTGSLPASPVVVDRRADLAVLRVPGLDVTPLRIAARDAANGAQAVVVGYPGGGPRTAVGAVIRQRIPVPDPGLADGLALHQAYRIDSTIRRGDSGSPLLDLQARVVGVVNATSGGPGTAGYAITLDELLPDLAAARTARTVVSTGTCS